MLKEIKTARLSETGREDIPKRGPDGGKGSSLDHGGSNSRNKKNLPI